MAVYKFAGFWRRLLAYTVDNIIINIILVILSIIAVLAFVFGSADRQTWLTDILDPTRMFYAVMTVLTIYFAIYILLSIAYFTYFHGIKGRTPGKMLLGLQVLSTEGTPIGFGIAFLRSVGYLVSSLLFTIPIGFIWAAFDRRKQGWHDKIAGTVVIILPRENEVAGLIIPEPQAPSPVPQANEIQSETGKQTEAQPNEPSAGENKEMADQPNVNDQKIP